jgi:hypothetical protein
VGVFRAPIGILANVKHLALGIAYCLFGGLLIFVSFAKMGHVAYTQSLIWLGVGAALEVVGLGQLRLQRHH